MNLRMQSKRAFMVSLLLAFGFTLIAVLLEYNRLTGFDNMLIALVQGMESPGLTGVMKFFTFIGSGQMVAILSFVIMFFLYKVLGHRRELILFIWSIAGSEVLNILLKFLFHRERPSLHRLIEITGFSFPSGHSMAAFALYATTAYLLWRHAEGIGRLILLLVCALMIMMIGISRIYLGVHYPSDVIGGYLASGFWLSLCTAFFYRRKAREGGG